MNRMNTKIIIAVTNRLSAAPDSDAKTELIEELSENLYQRYEDIVADGTAEQEAYEQAMDSLGDVDELLAYLEDVTGETKDSQDADWRDSAFNEADNTAGKSEDTGRANMDFGDFGELGREISGLVEKAVKGAQEAVKYAQTMTKDIHGDGFVSDGKKNWDVFVSDEKEAEYIREQIPAGDIQGIEAALMNGDVEICIAEEDSEDIILTGDISRIETKVSEDGMLCIKQGNTASSSFLFNRGWASTDICITLPKRVWERIHAESKSGDITCDDFLEAKQLIVRSKNGDISFRGYAEKAELSTLSGDIAYTGDADAIACISTSGDIKVESGILPQNVKIETKSGDCNLKIPEGEGFVLNYRTISGELRSNMSLAGKFGERSGKVMYLDGGAREFFISTLSGDVYVEK